MKRFLPALLVFSLAGCEQARPPSAAVVAVRTAKGTRNTNLETKIQPEAPRAGTTSIWNFKVFDLENKPDGTRKEWKFFNALPQSSGDKTNTQVLMNAWLISKDKKIFLPQKPNYAQYGSFLTDWVVPVPGDYTLWVEYQPVIAKDELSFEDFQSKAKILSVEHARWNVSVSGNGTSSGLQPSMRPGENGELRLPSFGLDGNSYGARAPFEVRLVAPQLKTKQSVRLRWQVSGVEKDVSDASCTALSPSGNVLVHVVGNAPQITFSQAGRWRAWFSFSVSGKPYASPVDFHVS